MAKPSHRALFDASPGRAPSSPLRGGASATAASVASPSASSAPGTQDKESLRKRGEAEFDVSEELSGYGLQGVKVTDDDLLALVEELGLGGEEAGDLVKGLSDPADKADRAKAGDTAEVLEGAGGGSEQPEAESGAEAKPAVAREETEAAEGDGVEKVDTKVANVAST